MQEKQGSPYRVFMWGALLVAVVCFGLAWERIQSRHPARADIYSIAGILGLLCAAGALSSGSAHERSRKSQENLQGSVEKLQERMQEMPRTLMEDAVKVAEKESNDRRADQLKQAAELRRALEEGLQTGFAPIAPALSQRIGESLNSLSSSLTSDRDERAENLRKMGETLSGIQTSQKDWAQTSSALLEKLREQGTALQREISERDSGWKSGVEKLTQESGMFFQKVAEESGTRFQKAADEAEARFQRAVDSHAAQMREYVSQGLGNARESLSAMGAESSEQLRRSAEQAQNWLQGLSQAATALQDAAQGAQHMSEASSANQAGMKAAVEMLNQSLGGVLDRLQSFATLAQGQEALLEKMETTVRRFEERSAELLEENALKIQESFLDALEKADSKNA